MLKSLFRSVVGNKTVVESKTATQLPASEAAVETSAAEVEIVTSPMPEASTVQAGAVSEPPVQIMESTTVSEPLVADGRKAASLLVYGPCSNAGDVLIHRAIEKLFEDDITFRYHHIRQDKLIDMEKNIVVGPGGILSGSYTPEKKPDEWLIRHLNRKKVQSWRKEGKNVVFFGTGTNTPMTATKTQKPFSGVSENTLADLFDLSKGVYLRGSYDRNRLQMLGDAKDVHKLVYQPCPSLFIDQWAENPRPKSDVIAINFPLNKGLTASNVRTHPLHKFVSYARSCGLECVFSPNHTQDVNPYIFDVFDRVDISDELADFICSDSFAEVPDAQKRIQEEWMSLDCIFSRFSGHRFAFGSRLHSFLPFMAYETPSLFLSGNEVRKSMPVDYFDNPIFLAKAAYHPAKCEQMVDGMIERLNFFIRNEEALVANIRESKERLWELTQRNRAAMLEQLD